MIPKLYEPCNCEYCKGIGASITEIDTDGINEEITRIIELIWNTKKELDVDRALLRQNAKLLLDAVTSGYGKNIVNVVFGSPDFGMLENLTNNVYQFSAAKNYQELKDFTIALRDGDRIRTFSEYKEACLSISDKYDKTWLLTEYNQAIASSQMASRWADFSANKEDMPTLQYQTVGDSNVRESHALLNGIKKEIDDAFWNTYYPPNGWGCRCDVIQLTSRNAKSTDTTDRKLPIVPDMWKINVGKQGIVFPPQSAFYKGIPGEVWKTINKEIRAEVNNYYNDICRKKIDSLDLPKSSEHDNLYSKNLYMSKKSLKIDVVGHLAAAEKLQYKVLVDNIDKLKKPKLSILDPKKENYEKKKKRGVKGYITYDLTANKKKYVVINELYEGFEKPYVIKQKRN